MHYAGITDRLKGLGSDKWAVHIEGQGPPSARRASSSSCRSASPIHRLPKPSSMSPTARCAPAAPATPTAAAKRASSPPSRAIIASRPGGRSRPSSSCSCPAPRPRSMLAMMGIVEADDEVLMFDPYYATYEGVIAAAGGAPCAGARPIPIAAFIRASAISSVPSRRARAHSSSTRRAIRPAPCSRARRSRRSARSARATICGSSPTRSMPR